jgi:predicted dehydrogenase
MKPTSESSPRTQDPAASGDGVSRRSFVTAAAAATAGWTIVPRRVLGRGYRAPSDTLAIAGIGAAGKGASDIDGCATENIVALCDIDFRYARRTAERYPNARRYADFRELLDKEPGIDAVTVSTPDHTHAVIALEAMRRGKHVFCQKPLTRTLEECRKLVDVARETGVATQMGNQGHAMDDTRKIREWLEAGLIGEVREVHFWTNRPIWKQAVNRPTEMHHVPEQVHWDLWLGPVRERPYHPDFYHPFSWRGWWDFGTGALGDMACHIMDAAFWAYDLRDPETIVAETTQLYPETAPASSRITYQFPARGGRQAMTAVWRDGGLLPPKHFAWDAPAPWPGAANGAAFYGSKGLLISGEYGQNPQLYPAALMAEATASPPPEKYPRTEGVYAEWIAACKGGRRAGSDFVAHAGPLTEMVLLGNLAVRTGETIRWDSKKMTSGSATADELIRDTYRAGWSL